MNYALSIRQSNQQPHIDIENDIQLKKNGLLTFTLRVKNSNIVDYNPMEYTNGREYANLSFTQIVIKKFTTAFHSGK